MEKLVFLEKPFLYEREAILLPLEQEEMGKMVVNEDEFKLGWRFAEGALLFAVLFSFSIKYLLAILWR